MKFELAPYHRDIPDQDLIDDLIRVAKRLATNRVTIDQYNEHGNFNSATFQRRFGGWLKSLQKAGLQQTRTYGITDEEYFRNLEHVWLTLGRQPYYGEIEKPFSKYSKKAYCYRFGTWRKSLQAFIDYVNAAEDIDNTDTFSNKTLTGVKKHKTKRSPSWRLRFLVMRRDNFRCRICGAVQNIEKGITLHVDHIVPWTKGGETISDNLQTLCNYCNTGKSDLPMKT